MADEAYDAALAQHVCQLGMVTAAQVEEARRTQAEAARRGAALSLADALVQLDYLTKVQRENIEPEVRARREGARMLGQYKLLRPLGEGGMGAVFLAEDTIGQRTVAVKVLARKRAGDSQFVSRFRREAKAAGRLNHPNIVGAYTTGVEQGQHYLVMEYCEGESLNKTIRRDGFLPWDRAVEIIIQVAHGLQHAHAHAIIHRDIKPPNIIVANDGTAKILDMGLSKDIGAGEQSFSTQTGMALGTPHYISPEQARGERNIDGRADIYSLGATLYHMVTGRTPFEGLTGAMIMLKHIHEQIPNPQDIREDIPDSVAQVIQKMTAKEPADRYRDCTELLGDLELVLMGKMPTTQVLAVNRSAAAMGVGPARQAAGETPAVGAAQDETAVQAGEQPGQGGQFAQPAEQPGEAVMLAPQQGRRHQPPFLGGGTRKDEPVEEEIELTPVPQEPGARASMWKIICASVGVGLLLVLVTALLSGGPKKKMADGNQPPGPLPPTAAPNTPPGTTGGDNRKPAAPAT
ncbi:MAG: serine/threonine-protein kinase, partial [Planctomycetota bacterium]|nr:serine/threonine-protein kinase [Planctomycetota bacterium]